MAAVENRQHVLVLLAVATLVCSTLAMDGNLVRYEKGIEPYADVEIRKPRSDSSPARLEQSNRPRYGREDLLREGMGMADERKDATVYSMSDKVTTKLPLFAIKEGVAEDDYTPRRATESCTTGDAQDVRNLVITTMTWNMGEGNEIPTVPQLEALLTSGMPASTAAATREFPFYRGSSLADIPEDEPKGAHTFATKPHIIALGIQEFRKASTNYAKQLHDNLLLAIQNVHGSGFGELPTDANNPGYRAAQFTMNNSPPTQALIVFTRCKEVVYQTVVRHANNNGKGGFGWVLRVDYKNKFGGSISKPVVIMTCHLPSGDKKQANRLSVMQDILRSAESAVLSTDSSADPLSNTVMILMGDYNSRSTWPLHEVMMRLRLSSSMLQDLLVQDQLIQSKEVTDSILMYEPSISFLPSYKRYYWPLDGLSSYEAGVKTAIKTDPLDPEVEGKVRVEMPNGDIMSGALKKGELPYFIINNYKKDKMSTKIKMMAGRTQSEHTPSYTDRVLVRPGIYDKDLMPVWHCNTYTTCEDPLCATSDHAPVIAEFGFKLDSAAVGPKFPLVPSNIGGMAIAAALKGLRHSGVVAEKGDIGALRQRHLDPESSTMGDTLQKARDAMRIAMDAEDDLGDGSGDFGDNDKVALVKQFDEDDRRPRDQPSRRGRRLFRKVFPRPAHYTADQDLDSTPFGP